MTINQIIEQVKDDVLKKGYWAIVKTASERNEYSVFGLLIPYDKEEGGDLYHYTKMALSMQAGYGAQVYPEADDFELVDLEMHHPQNNLLKRYNIYTGEAK